MAASGLREHGLHEYFPQLKWLEGNMETHEPYFTQDYFLKKRCKFSNIVRACIQDDSGNGLAYTVLLNGWIRVVGTHDIIVKLLSVFFGVLCIPATFFCARAITSSVPIGILSALYVAIHPGLIYYSQTVRSYSMGVLVGIVSTSFFLRMFRGDRSHLTVILYCVASSIALLTHYFICYLLVSHVVLAVLFMRKEKTFNPFILSFGVCLIALATWMLLGGLQGQELMSAQNSRLTDLMKQHAPGYSDWIKPITFSNVAVCIWHQIGLLAGVIFNPTPQVNFWTSPVLVNLVLLSTGLIVVLRNALLSRQGKIGLFVIFALTIAAPVFTLALALKSRHTVPFDIRYLSFAVPYFAIFVGFIVAKMASAKGSGKKWLVRCMAFAITLSIVPVISLGDEQVRSLAFQPNKFLVLSRLIKMQYQRDQIVCYPTWSSAAFTNLYFEDCKFPIAQRVDTKSNDVSLQDTHGNTIRILMDIAVNKGSW